MFKIKEIKLIDHEIYLTKYGLNYFKLTNGAYLITGNSKVDLSTINLTDKTSSNQFQIIKSVDDISPSFEVGSSNSFPLVFIHTPRTGGTSIIDYFDSVSFLSRHPARDTCQISSIIELQEYNSFVLHSGVDFLSKFSAVRVGTFLRNPITRIFSSWVQIKRTSQLDDIPSYIGQFDSFIDYMIDSEPGFFYQYAANFSVGKDSFIAKNIQADSNLVKIAVENLLKFNYVGIYEFYNDSFINLIKVFNLPYLGRYHSNIGEKQLSISKRLLKRLTNKLELDIQIYESVCDEKKLFIR